MTPDERVAALLLVIENLQDALLKVEWVRSHGGTWMCAFCGGVPIDHGGDDHRDGCEYQRLIGWNEKNAGVAQSAEPQIFNLQDGGSTPPRLHHDDADRARAAPGDLCGHCQHPAKNHLPGRCRAHRCGCGRFVAQAQNDVPRS